jgi:hypothetical protein
MKIIITESQKRIILTESTGEELGNIIKQNTERAINILKESQAQMGLNLQFLFTWGAGIGGFMGPVEDFIRGRFPELSEQELLYILIGVIATYFIDNKKTVSKIYTEIQENGLSKVFEVVLRKTDTLKNTFLNFVESLGVTFHKITNMVSYLFILPLIPPLANLVFNGSLGNMDSRELAMRIIGFAGVTISGIIFRELILKMVRRFKS